jgi:hypothetical protein
MAQLLKKVDTKLRKKMVEISKRLYGRGLVAGARANKIEQKVREKNYM